MKADIDASASDSNVERQVALERSMWRVRWFGIALGIWQVVSYEPNPGTTVPASVVPLALSALAVLLVLNVWLTVTLRRRRTERALHMIGATAFVVDVAAVWTLVWAYTFEEYGQTWVILTILCLEGALRYQMRGALTPVWLATIVESSREAFRSAGFPDFAVQSLSSRVSSVTFRVGIMAMVAAVAGAIARNLGRARAEAEERAAQLEDLVSREAAARKESNAFQQVVLAGVSADGLTEALQRMIEHIAMDLGYERIAVMMEDGQGRIYVVAHHGFPEEAKALTAGLHDSIVGRVATTGMPVLLPDVTKDPQYFPADPATRSQITLPIRSGSTVIGVLDVESDLLDGFDEADASRLQRLSDQMSLVIENARLLSQERSAVERMKQLDTMKSDFIAIASHELRTPLTAMQGSIKTLRRNDERLSRDQIQDMLTILDRQTDRLARLVEDLLIVSRIDATGFSLHMEALRVEMLTKDLVEQIGPRASRVSVAIAPDIPMIVTDAQRVGQVLRNLVENALKFAPEDSTVRVSMHFDKGWIIFQVADDGPGIPSEDLPHIFDRFYQVGGSMRRRSEGFGLGLYITKRLVEALGGAVAVESKPGEGTTFLVRIPVATAEGSSSEIA